MAITNAWTKTISPANLPDGAIVPSVAELEGPINKEEFTLDLDAATCDNATETTAFTAIRDAVKVASDSNWFSDGFGIDSALTVSMRTVITGIERRFDTVEPGDYKMQYTAATDIFHVTGYVQWVVFSFFHHTKTEFMKKSFCLMAAMVITIVTAFVLTEVALDTVPVVTIPTDPTAWFDLSRVEGLYGVVVIIGG